MALSRVTNPFLSSSGAGNASITSPAANTIAFTTSTTERMRITNDGNVGIGTTGPSNFGGTNLQVANTNIASVVWTNGTYTGQLLASASAEVTIGSRSNHVLRFATNDTERMRIDTAGLLTLASGQIKFPASQNSSADANTLDDYEEGTFTPTIFGYTTAGVGTYSNQSGSYVKVGQIVSIYIRMDWSAHTGTGIMGFGGLPFTSAGTFTHGAALNGMAGLTVAASCYVAANIASGTTTGIFLQIPVGGGSDTQLPIDSAGIILFTITYRASA